MLQTIWKDPDRYKATYFGKWPGIYYVGDYAIRDPDEYFWLLGRADEVLKVAGHRIGTVELESALYLIQQSLKQQSWGKKTQLKAKSQ